MVLTLSILMDAFFIVLLAWCAYTDIKTRTVSNVSILLLLCLGVVHTALMLLFGNTWWAYLAGLLLSTPFFIAWLQDSMGAGDVKLLMGIGLFLGLVNTLVAFVLMIPVLVVCTILSRRKNGTVKSAIPFAPVLAFGAGGTLVFGYIITFIKL